MRHDQTVEPDPYALPAFIISIVAAVVAGLAFIWSILWSVISWSLAGPVIRVRLGVHRSDVEMKMWVYVWNRGRLPVSVEEVSLHLRDDSTALVPVLGVPEIPYRLEPGASWAPEAEFERGSSFYWSTKFEARVTLATGAVKKARVKLKPLPSDD